MMAIISICWRVTHPGHPDSLDYVRAPPDHGSPLEGLSSLLSDVKLEKQFSSTGPSKGPPGIGVCDVRSVTKARPVFI